MTRKAISVLIAAVIAFSLLPAVSAFAAATGTAYLTDGDEVLPGANTPFSIEVQAVDRPVNFIRIFYPTARSGISANPLNPVTPPDGWKSAYIAQGSANAVVFYGGQILPGGAVELTFPGDVARPLDRDKSGTWVVQLSSNGGATASDASVAPLETLTTDVRILDTETVSLVSPNGILDKSGTEFQTIQMRSTIKNHALSSVEVTPTLSASAGVNWLNDEQVSAGAKQVVASGATATFNHTVILGSAKRSTRGGGYAGDKQTTFTADATAPGSNGYGNERVSEFVVQMQPTISLPTTADVAPQTFAARPAASQANMTMPLSKANTPAVNVTSGTVNFADSSCALSTPVTFGNGDGTENALPWLCTIQGGFTGEESFDANVTLTGIDENDAPFSASYTPMSDDRTPSSTLSFTLDSLVPVVTLDLRLPRDEDGNQQTAVKKGDTLRIVGSVDDVDATLDFVELRSSTGEQAARAEIVEVPDYVNDTTNFVATVTVPFEAAIGKVHAYGKATDPAGWVGEGLSQVHDLDNIKPLLNFGQTVSTTDVQTMVVDQEEEFEPTMIRVSFAEVSEAGARGGCNPGQWKVDGAQVVVAVLFPSADGESWVPCEKDAKAPNNSNERLLLLGVPIERNATPSVTYTPMAGDRVHDGAGNTAVQRVVDTVAGIKPPLPALIDVYRNTGTTATGEECADRCETAYYDSAEDSYYTRFSGNDLLVHVERGAPGYTLQVLDALDQVIASKAVATIEPSIRVPLGTTDGLYARSLRFVNARGLAGDKLDLNITLDRALPQLASPVEVTEAETKDQLKVPFNEPVVEGGNLIADWILFDEFAPGQYDQYGPDDIRQDPKVPAAWSGWEPGYRILTAHTSRTDDATFAGAGYVFASFVENHVRYGDRAGNKLADIGEPAAKPAPAAAPAPGPAEDILP